MIFLILLGAELLNGFFALSQLPAGAALWIEQQAVAADGRDARAPR